MPSGRLSAAPVARASASIYAIGVPEGRSLEGGSSPSGDLPGVARPPGPMQARGHMPPPPAPGPRSFHSNPVTLTRYDAPGILSGTSK